MITKFAKTLLFFSACVSLLSASSFAIECCDKQISTITTDASVNREITPDTAKIRFTVVNTGINLKDIKEKNDKIVNQAINAIKTQLSSNEKIKTVAFNVSNLYSYKNKIRVFDKYQVTNGFEVKIKDLEKIQSIINLAMDNGVKNVGNVNFMVEDTETICNDMMSEAIKIGKNRVEKLAIAAGTNIDKVKSINPYCSLSSSHTVQPRLYKSVANSMDAMSDGAETQIETIEPGTINARANVNLTYYLK